MGITPDIGTTLYKDAEHLLMNLLDIEVPVIAAVNGPALVHAEIGRAIGYRACDGERTIPGRASFSGGLVPGDGVHVIWPLVLGINRGRYFLLTGQKLSAQEAQTLGVVNEVLPPERLPSRARGNWQNNSPPSHAWRFAMHV